MAKTKTIHAYELELRKMIESRTDAACEAWLTPQIRVTAMNMVMLDKIQDEITKETDLVKLVNGSQGQQKNEINPLLPTYDKLQRTMLMQLESLGLNYSTTPSKVKEDTKRGSVTKKDKLFSMLKSARENMTDIPDIDRHD